MELLREIQFLKALKKTNFIIASTFLMFFSVLNIFVEFFAFNFATAIISLFLPGYLLARLILEKLETIEAIIFGIVLSIGLEVIMVVILVKVFAFPFNKITIIESAVLLCIALIALLELKGFLSEYTIVKE